MVSSWSRVYFFNATGNYGFFVVSGYGKGGVGPITTHLSSHKDYFWLDGGNFVSYQSKNYLVMRNSTKYRSYHSLSMRRYY